MIDLNTAGPQQGGGSAAVGERYVKTPEAKAAVAGREGELLAALGVPNGTIHCPLPRRAHNDSNPSFGWDKHRRRAFCSCIPSWHPKGHKSLDIFGLIAEMRFGGDFNAAKIWAMEQLGKADLIHTKGGKEPRDRIADLLNPPPELRDDYVPFNYLSARLGAAPPQPVTPVAGWRALPYYDTAVEGKRASKLGDYPAAVFGMTDIDGNKHAHRIYTAPGGHGKADLPPLPDGTPRAIKKLAAGGDTSGLAVAWGSIDARMMIIAEGVETASAIATAFRAQLGENLGVVSAIHAGGVEAFRPGPKCQGVIVAADRDDAKTKRGEQAARQFCLKYHSRLSRVGYALPGEPGTDCDWLNVFVEQGAEAVRNGILAAQTFEPTPSDVALPARLPTTLQLGGADGEIILAIQANAIVLLNGAIGDHIAFDEFTNKPLWIGSGNPPWPWHAKLTFQGRVINDAFYNGAMIWLQSQGCHIRAKWMVRDAIMAIWEQRRFDSLKKYLDECRARAHSPQVCTIDTFLFVVMGVAPFGMLQDQIDEATGKWKYPPSDDDLKYVELHRRYVRAQSRNFFMRSVKRGIDPGSKCDEILNIQGEEGLGKSEVLRRLHSPWFSDHLPRQLDGKEAAELLSMGIWFWEIGDGSHLKRTNAEDFKNWASRESDNYRKPYDHEPATHLRRCTFGITSNDYDNLMSVTGNRDYRQSKADGASQSL